ncbi:MAG: chordopoxvirus fusion protein, partial [Candidatus Kryptonium sp.]|nr:chordopoxvirus fusion protein [Candidatus Kryptonium sp.]
ALAEAQRKTEERLNALALRVDELTQRVDALAEAQRKSEERINWLTQKIGELTDDIRALTNEMRDMRRRFGELSDSIGFGLEDRAYKVLPKLLKKDYGIDIKKILIRRFIKDKYGKDIEVNIFAHAEKDGQEITIIGECKSQLSKNDVENFIEYRLKRFEGVYPNIFPLVITYMESEPGVEEFVKQKEIAIYFSYELD